MATIQSIRVTTFYGGRFNATPQQHLF